MKGMMKVGTYTGTGAAINVQLGFRPDHIEIWNITDGNQHFVWTKGMAQPSAFQTVNHDTAQQSVITSNSISLYDGTAAGNRAGFSVGTAVSTNEKVYRYLALREDD
jgi:hypothetical protein